MLTDQQLQSLRNLGNEAEEAADAIVQMRAALSGLLALYDRHNDYLTPIGRANGRDTEADEVERWEAARQACGA
jgi:hypothetical protein